jgi:hypothetical protein
VAASPPDNAIPAPAPEKNPGRPARNPESIEVERLQKENEKLAARLAH